MCDSYLVVSGLPERNGKRHAAEIASMALHLLFYFKDFKIQHLPDQSLKFKMGIHTGKLCMWAAIHGVFTSIDPYIISLDHWVACGTSDVDRMLSCYVSTWKVFAIKQEKGVET